MARTLRAVATGMEPLTIHGRTISPTHLAGEPSVVYRSFTHSFINFSKPALVILSDGKNLIRTR